MKAWKKTVALLMALGMAFSVAACGDTEESSSSSGSSTGSSGGEQGGGNGETNVPKTEAEMFEYVMDAVEATEAYTGSIALTMDSERESKQTQGGTESANVSTESTTMSFDAVNKLMYMDEIEEDSEGKDEYYCKTFVQGGKLYGVEKGAFTPAVGSSQQAESGEDYFEIHDNAKAEYTNVDYDEYLEEVLGVLSGVRLAESAAEVKSAFETTLPVLFANQIPAGVTPTVTATGTVTGESGVYTFAFGFEVAYSVTQGNTTTAASSGMDCELSAKDGKLLEFDASRTMTQKTTQTDGTTVTTVSERSSVYSAVAMIDYAFAQAKYDAVTVTLPTNAADIYVLGAPAESFSDVEVDVYVNGEYHRTSELIDGMTPALALAAIIAQGDYFAENSVEIKAYKDEACTQDLTASAVTEAEILALEKVYLKATPKTGYAIVKVYNEERYEYSKPYQIVAPIILGSGTVSYGASANAYEAGEYPLWEDAVSGDDYEIWVNGVKMATKTATITLESGKTYEIKYVQVITDPVVDAD